MKKIRVHCSGCERSYTLGKNALVVTVLGVVSDFQSATILGSGTSFVDNRSNPDLIAPIECSWRSLDPSTARDQKAEIKRISPLLSPGRPPRWWRCRECGNIQAYQLR